jgi:cytoplasmic tRNA 2-thiolation protein 2
MPAASLTLCADCQQNSAEHEIRKRLLCQDCCVKYVSTKVVKRMESYRPKNQIGTTKPRLLLPLSGGVSSLGLLHILDAQLQRQRANQNRIAYDLVITHVDNASPPLQSAPAWYTQLKDRFPRHTYLPPQHISAIFTRDAALSTSLSLLGAPAPTPASADGALDQYTDLINHTTSRTAQSDIVSILLLRLLVHTAHENACTGLLLGHSDTRLATLTLSSVATGRGGAAPGLLADGQSAAHDLAFNHPCRDLILTELNLFGQIVGIAELGSGEGEMDGSSSVAKAVPSVRGMAMQDLLGLYISGQSQKYPSIMANVVRTAGKLASEEPQMEGGQGRWCLFCRGAVIDSREQSSQGVERAEGLCYGCERMRQDIRMLKDIPG